MSKLPLKQTTAAFLLFFLLLTAGSRAFAHLPRLVGEEEVVEIKDPEVSQAFYGQLPGEPVLYEIYAREDFLLYVSLLVPDLPDIKTDISALVTRINEVGEEHLSLLEGEKHPWEEFYEPFAGDHYLEGPEFEKEVPQGTYLIEVFSPQNTGKYVLSVGKQEVFTPAETIHTLKTLPALKGDFFEKSPLTAFFNLIGLFILIVLVLVVVPLYLLTRWGWKKFRQS